MTDCAHPSKYQFKKLESAHEAMTILNRKFEWENWSCRICDGQPAAVCEYAGSLCYVKLKSGDQTEVSFGLSIIAEQSIVSRLMFADYLDEAGDMRGELVRVECELDESVEWFDKGRTQVMTFNGDAEHFEQLRDRRYKLHKLLGYPCLECQVAAKTFRMKCRRCLDD